jgi:hypothetical protein
MKQHLAKTKLTCQICGGLLNGRQTAFCSPRCKERFHQSYQSQQERGLQRKLDLVQQFGAKCIHCGYSRNLAAFVFHHREPDKKQFQLDLRSLSNRTMEVIQDEVAKCDLVCANCHAEVHHPQLNLTQPKILLDQLTHH